MASPEIIEFCGSSSRLPSSFPISLRSRAPRSSVEDIVLAILVHSLSSQEREVKTGRSMVEGVEA